MTQELVSWGALVDQITRAQGVAFFFGAGVSRPSGLSLSHELQEYVLERLSAPQALRDRLAERPFEAVVGTVFYRITASSRRVAGQGAAPNEWRSGSERWASPRAGIYWVSMTGLNDDTENLQ